MLRILLFLAGAVRNTRVPGGYFKHTYYGGYDGDIEGVEDGAESLGGVCR
jgi:hypothetical protein